MKFAKYMMPALLGLALSCAVLNAAQYGPTTIVSSNTFGLITNTTDRVIDCTEVENIVLEMSCTSPADSTSNLTVNLKWSMDGSNTDSLYTHTFARPLPGAIASCRWMTNFATLGYGYLVIDSIWNQEETAVTNLVIKAWKKYFRQK